MLAQFSEFSGLVRICPVAVYTNVGLYDPEHQYWYAHTTLTKATCPRLPISSYNMAHRKCIQLVAAEVVILQFSYSAAATLAFPSQSIVHASCTRQYCH